jgi:hypothetical protein
MQALQFSRQSAPKLSRLLINNRKQATAARIALPRRPPSVVSPDRFERRRANPWGTTKAPFNRLAAVLTGPFPALSSKSFVGKK